MATDTQTIRLFHPTADPRTALITVKPSFHQAEQLLIRVVRGKGLSEQGMIYGPYHLSETKARVGEILTQFKTEGYRPSGQHDRLADLRSEDSAKRARAALRIGWMRETELLDELLQALPKAIDDSCSILDALGLLGDPRAIPAVRPYAERKLLSRRRSAAEALRALGDEEGLSKVRALALERLPESIQSAYEQDHVVNMATAVSALPLNERGPALETLYELGTPESSEAVRQVLSKTAFAQPHIWRNVKSLFKRALLRRDEIMFGWLFHEIEKQAKGQVYGKAVKASVKSGYDGQQRTTSIGSLTTVGFMVRLTWRYLKTLASHRPQTYPYMAASLLAAYEDLDGRAMLQSDPDSPFARYYVFGRVLHGGSGNWKFDSWSLRFRFRSQKKNPKEKEKAKVREEAFPDLWDAEPLAYLRLLTTAKSTVVQEFAYKAMQGPSGSILKSATIADLEAMLNSFYAGTVDLALQELSNRYDPDSPEFWPLLRRVLQIDKPMARLLAQSWLKKSLDRWSTKPELAFEFLTSSLVSARSLAADLLVEQYGNQKLSDAFRANLADRICQALGNLATIGNVGEDWDALARMAGIVLEDVLNQRLSVQDLVNWIVRGSAPIQALAGSLLDCRSDVFIALGMTRLLELSGHASALVRQAMRSAAWREVELFREDPNRLLPLIESEWDDNRAFALNLIKTQIGSATLGFDGILALLDSHLSDVRATGVDLAKEAFQSSPALARGFTERLIEHPAKDLRLFIIELAESHLADGAEALQAVVGLLRAGMMDFWPRRAVKDRIFQFLEKRGSQDQNQGQIAMSLLEDFARMQCDRDSTMALEVLARLQLRWREENE